MVTRKAGKMARPTKMTPETLDKLRQAYLIGANDKEAYAYAGISHETFYNYIQKHPEFREQIDRWQDEPILKAKTTIVKNLDDVKNSQWYLERKRKDEFSVRTENDTAVSIDLAGKILQAYGLKESDDRKTDGAVDRPSQDQA